MQFCYNCLVFLVTVVIQCARANVCERIYRKPEPIVATSHHQGAPGASRCVYFIEAPTGHYVQLNFTEFHGFASSIAAATATASADNGCLPKVEVMEVMDESLERELATLCEGNGHLVAPRVLSTNWHHVKLTFSWPEVGGHGSHGGGDLADNLSGFRVVFRFHKLQDGCQFKCRGDGRCLPQTTLVCNGLSDCVDGSDEVGCPPAATSSRPQAAAGYLHIVVITLCVVFALCAIACLANHWRLTGGGGGGGGGGAGGRSWHLTSCGERQRSSRGGSAGSAAENSRLQPQTSSLCSTDMCDDMRELSRECGGGGRESGSDALRPAPLQHPPNLPPAIARSNDGEEGYAASVQCLSKATRDEASPFTPAPNRTVTHADALYAAKTLRHSLPQRGDPPPPYTVGAPSRRNGKGVASV